MAAIRAFRPASNLPSSSFTYIRISRETCSFLLLPVCSFLPVSPIFSMSLCSTCMWISSRASRKGSLPSAISVSISFNPAMMRPVSSSLRIPARFRPRAYAMLPSMS